MKNKLVISIDVEDWYHGPSILDPINQRKSLENISSKNIQRAYKYIPSILEMLNKYNIKATFFWVARYAQLYPKLLELVVKEGHEIACHGLEHYSKIDKKTKKDIYSKEEFIKRTKLAKIY